MPCHSIGLSKRNLLRELIHLYTLIVRQESVSTQFILYLVIRKVYKMKKQTCIIKNCICKLHIEMEKALKNDKLYDKFQETCERYAKRYIITLKKDTTPLIKEIKDIYEAHVFQYKKDVMSLPEFAELDYK